MASDIPECACGAGKMELRCAGKAAMHAGRYYLRCPHNGKHPGSFRWFDDFQRQLTNSWSGIGRDKVGHSSHVRVRHTSGDDLSNYDCGKCCRTNRNNEIKAQFVVRLHGIVHVLGRCCDWQDFVKLEWG
ncbi:hypothetical protein AAHA92_02386 [Salvia divinorum]|uniref:Zinc finger GRF-type domain-containing protein n=1 Tax=Salvia divinorum TaxID=28513 RepID=A0ABD1IH03_SALDI